MNDTDHSPGDSIQYNFVYDLHNDIDHDDKQTDNHVHDHDHTDKHYNADEHDHTDSLLVTRRCVEAREH